MNDFVSQSVAPTPACLHFTAMVLQIFAVFVDFNDFQVPGRKEQKEMHDSEQMQQ